MGFGLLIVAVDQLVKNASVAFLTPGQPVELIGSVLSLSLIRNPGAAFGMGANFTIVFTAFAIIAALACLIIGVPRITKPWHAVTLGLLLGGIGGNLVDRITQPPAPFYGHVIDMFQVPRFAIFNVADICITVAAAIILIHGVHAEIVERRTRTEAATA